MINSSTELENLQVSPPDAKPLLCAIKFKYMFVLILLCVILPLLVGIYASVDWEKLDDNVFK